MSPSHHLLTAICQRRSVPLLALVRGIQPTNSINQLANNAVLAQDESYEGEYRALQDNLLAAQNDNLEDRDGELGKRIGNLVAPVAQKLGEAASKMIQ